MPRSPGVDRQGSAMSFAASGASRVRRTPRISSRLGIGYGIFVKGLSMIFSRCMDVGRRAGWSGHGFAGSGWYVCESSNTRRRLTRGE